MNSLTKATIPTTETVAKDLPEPSRDDMPADPNTVLLAGLVVFAALAAAYIAAEVILPIVLAVVLMLLLQPGMRFLGRLHLPRSLAALLLILAVFAVVAGLARPCLARPNGGRNVCQKASRASRNGSVPSASQSRE